MFATPENGWFKKAMMACTFFENTNELAQVTGNFDGTGLTCGFMGWTIKYGDQQPLVKEFIQTYPGELEKLMPKTAVAYTAAISANISEGMNLVADWSHGRESVLEPYNSELLQFWNDPRMVVIQTVAAEKQMGGYAEKNTGTFSEVYNCDPQFGIYGFFYDVKVLNGSMKNTKIDAAYPVSHHVSRVDETHEDYRSAIVANANTAIAWMKNRHSGYLTRETNTNAGLWAPLIPKAEDWQLELFYLGYLRSMDCREEFKGVSLCRKGILAFGSGWINESLVDLSTIK